MARVEIRADKQAPMSPMIRLMCGDTRTQIVRIVVPRLFGDVDLCDLAWSIHVVNQKGATDVCLPHGEIQCTDNEIVIDWLVCSVATATPGITDFELVGVNENEEGHPIVWKSGIGKILVIECLNAEPSSDQEQQLTQLDKMIIYVRGELTNVIAAGDAAIEAARLANEAADRANEAAMNAGSGGSSGGSGTVSVGIASAEKLGVIRVGENLTINDKGILSVDTADDVEQDNTRPITSAAVHTTVGNIEILLSTI